MALLNSLVNPSISGATANPNEPKVEDWDYLLVPNFDTGVNQAKKPEELETTELLTALNVVPLQGRLVMSGGYTTQGGTTALTLRGTPQETMELLTNTGAITTLVVTTATVYTYDDDDDAYYYTSNGTATTLAASASVSASTITLTSASGWATGSYGNVELANGKKHNFQISSLNGTSATITPVLLTAATSMAVVTEAVTLAGADTNAISWEVIPASSVLLFTNEVDSVQVFNGTTCVTLDSVATGLPTNLKCDIIKLFHNYVMLINTTESGTKYPQRVRRSDLADYLTWNSGDAGYEDLYESSQPIRAAYIRGFYLYIFKADVSGTPGSIIRYDYVGAVDKLFDARPLVTSDGAIAKRAVVGVEGNLVFVGFRGIYGYDGGEKIVALSENIFEALFGASGELDEDKYYNINAVFLDETKELYIFYVHVGKSGNAPNRAVVLSLRTGGWFFRRFTDDVMDFRKVNITTTTAVAWSAVVGTWAAQTRVWKQKGVAYLHPSSDGVVYLTDLQSADDDGSAITSTIETKDYEVPSRTVRIDRVDVWWKGTTITAEYSVDAGVSWTAFTGSAFSPGAIYTKTSIGQQIAGNQFRFRFSSAIAGFALERIAIRFKEESSP